MIEAISRRNYFIEIWGACKCVTLPLKHSFDELLIELLSIVLCCKRYTMLDLHVGIHLDEFYPKIIDRCLILQRIVYIARSFTC